MDQGQKPAVEPIRLPGWVFRALNPIARRLVRRGRGPAEIVLLGFAGRKTGRRYEIPVGVVQLDEGVGVLTNEPWRHNFRNGHPVEVTAAGKKRETVANLVSEPEVVADELYRAIRRHGYKRAGRRLGLTINVDHEPTLEEITEAVLITGISIVYLGGGALPHR